MKHKVSEEKILEIHDEIFMNAFKEGTYDCEESLRILRHHLRPEPKPEMPRVFADRWSHENGDEITFRCPDGRGYGPNLIAAIDDALGGDYWRRKS